MSLFRFDSYLLKIKMQQTSITRISSCRSPYQQSNKYIKQESNYQEENINNFSTRIQALNDQAYQLIQQKKYPQAIKVLQQSQKMLEYAANSGRQIDRSWIIVILCNEACAHQKLWSLQHCIDYLQAVIINLQKWLQQIQWNQDLSDVNCRNKLCRNLNLKLILALSKMQYSALTSQVSAQQQALSSAHQALIDFKQLLERISNFQRNQTQRNSELTLNLVKVIEQTHMNEIKTQNLIDQVKNNLYQLQNKRFFLAFDSNKISEFSISNVLQIMPKTIKKFKSNNFSLQWFISQAGLTHIALYLSSCYFVISTQLRILHETKQSQSILAKSNIIEFSLQNLAGHTLEDLLQKNKSSINYHLISIKIATSMVLCQTNLLKHILQSFRNNYDLDLEQKYNKNQMQSQNHKNLSQQQNRTYEMGSPKSSNKLSNKINYMSDKQNIEMNKGQMLEFNIHKNHTKKLNALQEQKYNKQNKECRKKKNIYMKHQSPKISLFTIGNQKKLSRKKSQRSSKNRHNLTKKSKESKSRETTPQSHYLNPSSSRNKSFTSQKVNKSKPKSTSKQYFTMKSRIIECKNPINKLNSPKNNNSKNTGNNKIRSKQAPKVKEQISKYYM